MQSIPVQPSSHKILVLDSGVGGLSVCKHIRLRLPDVVLHYFSDNAGFPYGNKSPEFLQKRLADIVSQLLKKHYYAAVVIACNTASTVALPQLREQFDVPFIGVVPAIKTAASISKSGCFALLATPGTATRNYTSNLIDEFASEHRVIRIGSSELVQLIEDYLLSGELNKSEIQSTLADLLGHPLHDDIDVVVLGCTHFPLITGFLRELRPNWRWIESGPAIAARVETILIGSNTKQSALSFTQNKATQNKALTEPPTPAQEKNAHRFWTSSESVGPQYHRSEAFKTYLQGLGWNDEILFLSRT